MRDLVSGSIHQIGKIVGPELSDVVVTVLAVMPDMKDVLNVPVAVAVCGAMVIGLLPVMVNPPPGFVAVAVVELATAELVVDKPGITIPLPG